MNAHVVDFEHLHLERDALVTPNGRLPVHRIGRGEFATVYREDSPPGRVFALTARDTFDKDVLADVARVHPSPHLPAVTYFGLTTDKQKVFVMPYYHVPLSEHESPAGWGTYLKLKMCRAETPDAVPPAEANAHTLYCATRTGVQPEVVDALSALADVARDYDESFEFEFAPRNLGSDELQRLVLLDVIFSRDKLLAQRRRRAFVVPSVLAGLALAVGTAFYVWEP